ncbi:uncharacterized protein LOC116288899 [Actinia tenebrosa]|uniref:Uncharacterized protein LOC116288899 n=1 Tax=Actinia tenebrosa TaxID=6105 RepID=A0A6P8HGA9_ACTTE|nr:uncharacterized protein LOC116288899 [Actinia tenebrosa]
MVSTTNPETWNKSEKDSDSCLSDSSGSLSLSRHPSLAEISTITSNCSTSPITSDENYMERNLKSLKSQAASSESSIALLDLQLSGKTMMVPATPPKHTMKSDSSVAPTNTEDEPLTPTANLKMLVSAASPAIRDRETKKRELFTEPEQTSPIPSFCAVPSFALPMFDSKVVYRNGGFVHVNLRDGSESEKMVISRKDKSLGLLCQRFLAKYPENPSPSERIEISLDEVAKDLSVERRRIYDIVNVLESVEVISRFAKNRYMWHGKTRLPQTLAKLKQFAVTHGFTSKGGNTDKENPQMACQNKCAKAGTNKLPHLLPKNNKVCLPGMGCLPSMFDGEDDAWAKKQREADYCRKDKSLGVLSQKFLMMFLLSENRQVTLDDAANLLIDEEEEGKAKYKTKVRRLYDIANILSSLQLIQKVHIHNIQSGRKPGFRWIGIDLDSLDDLNKPTSDLNNHPKKRGGSSKNSLVEKEPVDTEESAFGRLISRRPSQQQLRRTKSDGNGKSKLPRSRSDRGFASKKRVLSSDSDNGASDKGDGYSIQEITGFRDDNSIRSPGSIKFHSELMKLKEQYPDHMSELLSACQAYLIPDENKKSRRTLFNGENSSQDDGPSSKRRKSSDDVMVKENESENATKFVHSATSPFKPFETEQNDINSTTKSPPAKHIIPSVVEGSPEQKILLEREKQKKLLEEQKDFDVKDERWKRMEDELEKALSKTRSEVSKNNDSIHSSVEIQANSIDDVSPLKPLSNYVKNMKPWYPLGKDKTVTQSTASKSGSLSPLSLQAMGVTPIAPSPVSNTTSPTNASVASSNNAQSVNLVSLTSSNLQSLWTMATCSAPSLHTSQAPLFLAMPQQHTFSSSASNPALLSVTPSTSETRKLLPLSHPPSEENCLGNIMQATTNIMPPSSTLPMNIVGTLNNANFIQESMTCLKDNQIIRPLVNVQPSVTQGFSPRMVMTAIPGIRGPARATVATPNQMTPILPKVITPQHPFSSVTGGTPCSNTVFVNSDIAKKLVMPDTKLN